MRDPEYDPFAESTYECLACGATVDAESPTGCPDCGGTLRNRALPME